MASASASQTLIASGAALEIKDAQACTPLHYAAAQGHIEVTKVLALAGASLKARDKAGKSPHDKAVDFRDALTCPRPRRPLVASRGDAAKGHSHE